MGNMIIVLLLLVMLSAAAAASVKHFRGEGGCCGGGSYKPKKKKLDRIIAKKIFLVEGMHCGNCSNKVMEAVNDISGVSAVVKLKEGIVEVSYAKVVEDAVIIEKIERAGYVVKM